jgi:hypothetical protein
LKFINLTAHSVDLLPLGVTIPHANSPVKVTQQQNLIGIVDGVPIYEIEFTDIAGLPKAEEGVMLIVSAPVLNYVREKLPHRKDVVATFKAIKNEFGKTVGCSALRVNG